MTMKNNNFLKWMFRIIAILCIYASCTNTVYLFGDLMRKENQEHKPTDKNHETNCYQVY